ncbi:ABC-type spermidine/putrescine transport system permease subunit I [Paraburkholderia sp. GAS32]
MSFHYLLLVKFACAALSLCLAVAAVRRRKVRSIAWIAVAVTVVPMLCAGWIEWTQWKVVLPSDKVFGPLGGFLWLCAVAALMASKRPPSLQHD